MTMHVQLERIGAEGHADLFVFKHTEHGSAVEATNNELVKSLREGRLYACLVDASKLVGLEHLLAGVHMASLSKAAGHMKTRHIHTEVLYALHPGKEIRKALSTFGVSSTTTVIAAVVIDGTDQQIKAVQEALPGEQVSPDTLKSHADNPEVQAFARKLYNVTDDELSFSSLSDAVISHMAYKQTL